MHSQHSMIKSPAHYKNVIMNLTPKINNQTKINNAHSNPTKLPLNANYTEQCITNSLTN